MSTITNNWSRAWQHFWFAQGSPKPLAIFRILFAIALAEDLPNAYAFSRYATTGGYHWPYWAHWPLLSADSYDLLHLAQCPLILLLAIGLWSRFSAASLLFLQSFVFFADHLNFRNHGYLFLLILGILALSPAGEAFSLQSSRRSSVPLTCQRLIQVQISLVYLWAAIHKLHPAYLSGAVLADTFHLRAQPPFLALAAVTVPAVELFLAFALWHRRGRVAVCATGLVMHASIAISMGIYGFSLAVVASYVLFLAPRART